ncbi:ribonuclease H-like domain-containing protein [Tanacetum coccineum]
MSWPVFQLDVNNAFLYGDLEEVVYMKPPEGYFPSDNKVCRLKKSLYGLKQAPRQWNVKLTSTLIENGFSQSNISEIEKFKVFLKSKFMIKDLGKLKYFLGIEVVDTDKGICLNQRKYVLNLLSEYGMLACKPTKTPLMSKIVISNEAFENDPLLENVTDYQKLMGKLIYLTNTRPDISYVVHCLSQFMHSPLSSHLKIAFKILRYLKSCPGLGIHIARTSSMFLNAYSDADWAKCIVTRKSVTGYCVFLNKSLVSWKSKKQNNLFKSSTEAKYRALASVTSEVIWILKILKDLQIEKLLPVSLHCDSNLAIKITVNLVFHERTKHLEINLHFVREKILKGVVKTVKVDSANQIADILTKGLDTVQHLELVKRLGYAQWSVDHDFQENFDDEVDKKISEEYLRDLDIEFHERALLDEEEVSDDEEMTQVKGLMALADDELVVGKNHARNGEWIDITMRKVERQNPDSKLPNFNIGRILVPESQAVNESLRLTEAPTNPESLKESGSEPQTPLPLLKILKGASPSSEVMPLTYQEQSPNERPSLVPNEVKNNEQESKINELTKLIPMLIDEKVKSSQKIQESKLVISEPESSRSVNSSKLSQ